MKKPFLPVNKILLATLAGISLTCFFGVSSSLADESTQTFSPLDSDRNSDFLSNPNSSDFSLFNVIHRANFGTINWDSNQQKQQLDEAAAGFKARQQKLLEGSKEQNPGTTSGENIPSNLVLPVNK
ncbi:hypothetical protein VB711_16570 [Cronbergia sp. UHCC 0137]|uniref:hypothetical protein n=1 Tax=Cronbergia sp. UHCC 0137 TaxID=3110239 RepID=UPI002B1FFB39|nr:hypothetical protein [Cronbergia sp. UHCC 0137]MEA5619444.1 hypothetical protein [Cronbergia sp. UHCC 0137]